MKRASRNFILFAGCILLLVLSIQAQDGAAVQAKGDAQVYYVHGVSGLEFGGPIDNAIEVWIGDEKITSESKYGDFLGPFFRKPGAAKFSVYRPGFGPDKGFSPEAEYTFTYEPGEVVLHVGHWNKDGNDVYLTKFPLDFSPLFDKKKSRVFVFHCAAAPYLSANFYDGSDPAEHPYVGHEALENRDKFVTEIGKGFKWALYVEEGRENGRTLYNKTFKLKPLKAHIVVIIGTPNTQSFRVVTNIPKKKLK